MSIIFAGAAFAQIDGATSGASDPPSVESPLERARAAVAENDAARAAEESDAAAQTRNRNPDLLYPRLPAGWQPDEESAAAIQRAVRGYYEYREKAYEHRAQVFDWQHFSTRLIFWVVILIVAMGLYFSWMQFAAARRDGAEMPVSTLKLGKAGVEVTSPVLGVVILVLSLAFFYLYLVHVYPIFETF